jgi:hypothetical protein
MSDTTIPMKHEIEILVEKERVAEAATQASMTLQRKVNENPRPDQEA